VKSSFRSIGLVAATLVTMAVVTPAQSQPGRPAPPALGDGPWDLRTETGMVHVSVLTKDLESPWGLAFLPDGGMLVTERPGRLRVIRDGTLDPKPIEGLPDLVSTGISGLFGLALHPDFARNRLIYFAYPKPQPADRDVMTLAVARARWDGGSSLADVKDIFVANDWYGTAESRENNRCCGQGPASGSFGARGELEPPNPQYLTTGDPNRGEKTPDPRSHNGKIVWFYE
jgi:glucose/arabinose dehydrogenase